MAAETIDEPGTTQASFKGQVNIESFGYEAVRRRSTRMKRKATEDPEPTAPAGGVEDASPPERPSSKPTKKPRAKGKPTATDATSASAVVASTKPARKPKSSYSSPSKYAHFGPYPIPDALGPNLLVLFVGYNPGEETARQGHAYANPSNRFWPFLHSSGLTPTRCRPAEDQTLPARFSLGLTNLVSRATKTAAELSVEELCAGAETVEAKVRQWRPEAVCFAGKGIWETVWLVKHGRKMTKAEFKYGFQDEEQNFGVVALDGPDAGEVEEGVVADPNWAGARVFVATTTSGLATTPTHAEKMANWKELGDWVAQRRIEREQSKAA